VASVSVSAPSHNITPQTLTKPQPLAPNNANGVPLTRIPARLPHHELSLPIQPRVPSLLFRPLFRPLSPEHETSAFGVVVQVTSVGPYGSDPATIAFAIAFSPAADGPAVHTHFPSLADPLIPAASFCMHNSCQATYMPCAESLW